MHQIEEINDRIEKLTKFVVDLSLETQIEYVSCDGYHSYYSSMHPNADIACPKCGKSQDSLGGSISKQVPTLLAKRAKSLLNQLGME